MRFFAFFHLETIFGAELQMKLNFDGDVQLKFWWRCQIHILVEMWDSLFGGGVKIDKLNYW